jgi:hypothetical protein
MTKEWEFAAEIPEFTVSGEAGGRGAVVLAPFVVSGDSFVMLGEVVIDPGVFVCEAFGPGFEVASDIRLSPAMFLFNVDGRTGWGGGGLRAEGFSVGGDLAGDYPMEGEMVFSPSFSASAVSGAEGATSFKGYVCDGEFIPGGRGWAEISLPQRPVVAGDMTEDPVFTGALQVSASTFRAVGVMLPWGEMEGEVTVPALRVRGLMEHEFFIQGEADLTVPSFTVLGQMIPGDQGIEAEIVLSRFRAAGFMRNISGAWSFTSQRATSSDALTQPDISAVPVMRYSR